MASVEVEGLKELIATIKRFPIDALRVTDETVKDAAITIETKAKTLVRVRTGLLRGSIRWRKIGIASYQVGSDISYAGFQEYGTRKMTAQPYLRPPKTEIEETLQKTLRKRLERVLISG